MEEIEGKLTFFQLPNFPTSKLPHFLTRVIVFINQKIIFIQVPFSKFAYISI